MNKVTLSIALGSILVLGALVIWAMKSNPGEPIGETHEIEGSQHIPDGTKVDYKTNPPTSGNHFAQPANWGAYDHELPDEQLVHNLEHGGVTIFYNPDKVDKKTIETLIQLAKPYPNKSIVAPRSKNDTAIALVSWRRLLKLDKLDTV